MKSEQLSFRRGFRLSLANGKAQGAVMVLAPGASEGGPDNLHRGADQWLYVVAGTGAAIINGHSKGLKAGTLLLIEAGDRHALDCVNTCRQRCLAGGEFERNVHFHLARRLRVYARDCEC